MLQDLVNILQPGLDADLDAIMKKLKGTFGVGNWSNTTKAPGKAAPEITGLISLGPGMLTVSPGCCSESGLVA